FADVPATHPFAPWIEQLARENITAGCATNPPHFCPQNPVTRAHMAAFLSSNFTLLPPADRLWRQHGGNAQRTSYSFDDVPHPWRWLWSWNGPNATGSIAKVTTGGSLPRNVQPVVGGGRVYVATGVDGVVALDEATGTTLWWRQGLGDIRSTVAYDPGTQAVFALATDGKLWKLRASDGVILGHYATGQSSLLPLPPALLAERVIVAVGSWVFAVRTGDLGLVWSYHAGATVAVPPAYSLSRDLILVATEPDLYVHAIRNWNGTQAWRVRPVHPSRNFADPTEYRYGWPVVADNAGLVLVKVRLGWQSVWQDWPQDNASMRAFLAANPGEQALFALRLDDGSVPFVVNVGHGGYGDHDYLPMGPQPVVKRFTHGKEVAYTIIRAKHVYDPRWDSHFGEVMLDDSTIPGLTGGDVRFIAFDWPPGATDPFLLTDEQPNVAMAQDTLFGGHWEALFALRILDRSPSRGSFAQKITSQRLATVVTSQDDPAGCPFSPTHFCSNNLRNTREYDFGFYLYFNQGAVYDQFWSEYATAVVSNGKIFFRSCDGALAVLGPAPSWPAAPANSSAQPPTAPMVPPTSPGAVVPVSEARAWAGRDVIVYGDVVYTVDNGKSTLIAFARPHQGTFKVLIPREVVTAWGNSSRLRLCTAGAQVRVNGRVEWYQGDPVIIVRQPGQLECTAQGGLP
ncbi:MAG: PQQ-binding-like beta-propeller repeat protein, partial [Thermoanaerobaculum sp.]|nr:PQQ-binding-like beta-propeller repeat protein [Thermoanaerobaculum sp.]